MGGRERGTDPRFLIDIGSEPFDPKAAPSRARQRVSTGKRKLARVLGIEVAELPGADREAWLVQLSDDPDAQTVRRFREVHGLRLAERISSLAFVERMDRGTVARVRRDPSVRTVVPYPPDLKLRTVDPTVSVAGARFEVGLIEGDDLASVTGVLGRLGLHVLLANDDTHAGADSSLLVETAQPTDLSLVAAIDDVAWIDDVGQLALENFDSAGVTQSGNPTSHPVWDKDLHGEKMIIGVLDGDDVDMASEFFSDPLDNRSGPGHRKIVLYRNAPLFDLGDGHATKVCGCVAGDVEGLPGSHPNRGGAWAARIAYGDVNRFIGEVISSTLLDELKAAAAAGARVHSNSWRAIPKKVALSPVRYNAMAAATDDFLWFNEDHLFVTAAPNPLDPADPNATHSGGPVIAKNPITVGGVSAAPDQNERRADLLPLTVDGRRKPDLLAVADGVVTSDLTDHGADPRKVTAPIQGNSFATPHVAAAAALVRQYFLEGWYPNGKKEDERRAITPSGALLKAVLLNATVPLTGAPYPSETDGWGRLELNQTLHFHGDKLRLWVQDVRRRVGLEATGRTQEYRLTVPPKARSMKITLVFNDRKGPTKKVDPVVNKLEIEVMEPRPSAFGYFGNDFVNPPSGFIGPRLPQSFRRDFTDRLSVRTDPAELKNNVRQVLVNDPTAGRWTIVVRAHMVDPFPEAQPGMEPPRPLQGYALVACIETA